MTRSVVVVSAIALAGFASVGAYHHLADRFAAPPIKVGILHSLTGTMAMSESSLVDAALLSIEEINARGGLLGRRIEPVIADGQSDWAMFARQAERLIVDEEVSVVFGCWTSACRKTVKPVFEKHRHLLFYPVQYEGLETSDNIIYTGATPNQQILPAVSWSLEHLGRKVFLVGSDYVFPRAANAIIADHVAALEGELAGEAYILLGSSDVESTIREIAEAQPDVIINTINGDSNVAFFEALERSGIDMPVMSLSIAEDELRALGANRMQGHYACWSYFQSLETVENKAFVAAFRARFGSDRVTDDPIEAAYFGVKLWALAVADAGTTRIASVRKSLEFLSYRAPEGIVTVDGMNHHTWRSVHIGRIRADGQFDIVWSDDRPVRPMPYPIFRSQHAWEELLGELHEGWGGVWHNPGEIEGNIREE